MKSLIVKIAVLIAVLFIQSNFAVAQKDTVQIKTSAVCKTCKKTIDEGLRFEKGVKSATLNVETKTVTVVYDSKKTNPNALRIAISKMGYDADSEKADPKAYKDLEDCCKKDAHHE